jgi:predicted lipid-binding transport protein (Tim44 family)
VAFTAQFDAAPVTDVWTFSRDVKSRDPNWLLITTAGDMPE